MRKVCYYRIFGKLLIVDNNEIDFKELEVVFEKMQENREIFTPRIEGWPIWPMIKLILFYRILYGLNGDKQQSFTKRVSSERWELFQKIKYFIRGYFDWTLLSLKNNPKRPVIMTFGGFSARYITEDDKYKNPFYDDIYLNKKREFDLFIIEDLNARKKHSTAVSNPQMTGEFLNFPGYIIGKFYRPNKKIKYEVKKLYTIIDNELKGYPDIVDIVRNEFNSGLAYRHIYRFFSIKKRASILIRKVKSSAVIITSSPRYYGVTAAAKEMDIPVIEIQHGVSNNLHPSYNWPAWACDRKSELPLANKMFMWGSYWTENHIAKGFWKKEDLLPFGFCRMDEERKKVHKCGHIANNKKSNLINLLFTPSRDTRKESVSFFSSFLKIVTQQNLKLMLNIKMHPNESADAHFYEDLHKQYPELCKIYKHADCSLYELLSISDLHLSVHSTTHYEAIGLQTPTMVIGLNGSELMSELLESCCARLCKTPEDLIAAVREVRDNTDWWKKWVEDTGNSKEQFFAENAADSYVNYLNEKLSGF